MQPMESNHSSLQQLDCISLTKKQKSLITMVVIVSILEFFDLFLIGFIVAILIQDKNWILTSAEISFILAAGGIGTVIGAILCGYLADKYGRKKSFILCIMIVVTFTGFSALTPVNNWIFLFLMRFFTGVGVGGLNIIAIPYLQEFMPTKQRGFFTGLASAFVPLGLLLGSVATRYLYDSLGWRGLLLVGCIPVFLLPWIRSMPESPRYLVLKGHFEEAKKAYAWAMNISTNEVGNLPKYAIHSTVSYMKIIRDNLKPLFIVSLGTFCFTFGSFIIQSWGQTLLSKCFNFSVTEVANLFIIISLGDLIGRLLSAYSSDYIGRRWTLFIFGSMGAIGCMIATFSLSYSTILFTPFLNSLSPAWFFLTGILVVMMFGDGAFGIINVFGGEMFSNEIRSTCLGLGYGMGATAKIIGPVFFGYLNDGIKLDSDGLFIPFLILGFVFLLGSIIYLFAKETKNIQLEEL